MDDARHKINDKLEEADAKIADAKAEWKDGQLEIESGWEKINDGIKELDEQEQTANKKFADAYAQIQDGYIQIEDGQRQFEQIATRAGAWKRTTDIGQTELENRQKKTFAQIEAGKNQLASAKTEALNGQAQIQDIYSRDLKYVRERLARGSMGSIIRNLYSRHIPL